MKNKEKIKLKVKRKQMYENFKGKVHNHKKLGKENDFYMKEPKKLLKEFSGIWG